ncbi:DUF222 domain-containing protein [Kytococcus sedentarius]|uniref:HNH endonuclease signature motif containing protein n=1 Tax=Kytococcus sedentarius TaxID=1276 RepID=UPI0035BC0AE0
MAAQPIDSEGAMPSPDVLELMARVESVAHEIAAMREGLWQLGSDDLGAALGVLGELVRAGEAAMTGVTAEAVDRGVVYESRAASTTAWVREQGSLVAPGRAHRVAAVAEATLEPDTQSVREAIWGGGVSVDLAAVALRETAKTLPVLPGADRSEVLGYFLEQASGPGATARELLDLQRQIVARFGEDILDDIDDRAKEASGLTERQLPTGLVRFVVDLNQPDAARLRGALDGLSAPQPGKDALGQPVRDPRSPARRRADALLELVERAQAAHEGQGARGCGLSGSTTLIVTTTAESLRERLAGAVAGRRRGWGRGIEQLEDGGPDTFGTSTHGEVFTAAQLREAACDANIVPMVLGADSAPLELGGSTRLASPEQRALLAVRDAGCTFPGCTRPPGWCHAHHVRHWADGGPTDVENLALLCGRHHRVVHRDGLSARLIGNRWVWDAGDDPPVGGLSDGGPSDLGLGRETPAGSPLDWWAS